GDATLMVDGENVSLLDAGKNWGNRAYFQKADPQLSSAEVLNSFLAQFYDDKTVPKQIMLSQTVEELELLAAALSEK
ncbi:hypothetical protein ACC760_40025, partial [Rhizobium ruizarguesonis]